MDHAGHDVAVTGIGYRCVAKFLQYLANLFQVALFVKSNHGNCGGAVHVTKERMLESRSGSDVPDRPAHTSLSFVTANDRTS